MRNARKHGWIALGMGLALSATVGVGGIAAAEEGILKPPHSVHGPISLADMAAKQLERLPWGVTVLQANLSARRPIAVSAAYLMHDDLLVVSSAGLVYCLSRRDLTPRWVSSLRAPLAQPPAEGPAHYSFVVRGHDGAYSVHAFAKRNGAEPEGFPARLPFAVSSPPGVDGSNVYLGSLGSVADQKTVVGLSLADGHSGWGWRTSGLVFGAPTPDPAGQLVVVASEDGRVTAVNGSAQAWTVDASGPIGVSPAVTPEHVIVGTQSGLLWCYDLGSGKTCWPPVGVDAPVRTKPWVVGRTVVEKQATGVEGAAPVEVSHYRGLAYVRNQNGLFAVDLTSGKIVFTEHRWGARPLAHAAQWVLTLDDQRNVLFRDAKDGYKVRDRLDLSMLDLIPTNDSTGSIYGVTHDGGVVAALPK